MKIMMKAHTLPCVRTVFQTGSWFSVELPTYKHITLKMMSRLKWKMLAIPSAKHRNMHSTPVLFKSAFTSSA